MACRISGAFIIRQAILVLILRKDIHRLGAAAALVLQMNVLHIAVDAQFHPDDQFVPYLQSPLDSLKFRPTTGAFLREQTFLQLERSPLVRCYLGHVLEVLPMETAPSDTLVDFLDADLP